MHVTLSNMSLPEGPPKKVKKAKTTKGGYTLANRGDLRSQDIKISVGGENTCLPDAF